MGFVVTIESKYNTLLKKLYHYLFTCPTFWSWKPKFTCPKCGRKYRCYWDGNDIDNHGINICNSCAKTIVKRENVKRMQQIECIVSGKCSSCGFINKKQQTKVIQADGTPIYNLKDAKDFGFAQCPKCKNVMPWKKEIISPKKL